ncbi:Protein of unknown function precursor [Tenacibaculum jejuense]|uniref:Uncharacterized protein n=2 Tax=Tenacibaculum jejuense TaxID=584609 RepID=A0A238U7X3_9FLAO|nr:Protein of unknown function precursor [Tenacibaculum jejuense]
MYTKNLSIFLFLYLFSLIAYSQTPEGFNYQSVVRNASGEILANANVGVELKLRQATADGTVIYTETHTTTTNGYGVFSLIVGQGATVDTFSTIDWASNSHFLEVSIDIAGGTTYVSMGTTQLLSVPYALQAKYVENGDNLGNHTLTENIKTDGKWISNDGDDEGLLVNSGGRVTTSHKLFLGSNINLDTHWINGDGTNDSGIQFDTNGNVITSAKISLGGNIQINSNWISNDGDDEGIAIKADGSVGIGESNPQTSLDVVDNAVIGNIAVGSQSTTQNASNQKDEGYMTTPWIYTSAIQAPGERDSSPTMIAVGGDNNFGKADEIHFVTNGTSQVEITDGLLNVSGSIKSTGNFELDGALTTSSFENQIFGSYDDTSNLSNLERRNVIIGYQAAEGAQSGDSNVVIGYFAGYNLNGDSNVLIGTAAGAGGSFSNQLHIRNLIYGEFDNDYLQVNGELKVEENIATDGNVVIDQDGDDLRAAGASNNVEIISIIVNADGSLNTNVTNSSGITASRSGNTYTVNYSNHFSNLPAVTITCIGSTSVTRAAMITSLAQGKVEYQVRSSGGDNKTDAATVLHIIGKR